MTIKIPALSLLLLAFSTGAVAAQNAPPTAGGICTEARANLLRARLTHLQKPIRDEMVIARIFQSGINDYYAELREESEAHKKYPDRWAVAFYAIGQSDILSDSRIAYSVGDRIAVQGTVGVAQQRGRHATACLQNHHVYRLESGLHAITGVVLVLL